MEALTAHVQTVFADETVTVAEVGGGVGVEVDQRVGDLGGGKGRKVERKGN